MFAEVFHIFKVEELSGKAVFMIFQQHPSPHTRPSFMVELPLWLS